LNKFTGKGLTVVLSTGTLCVQRCGRNGSATIEKFGNSSSAKN